MLQCVAVYCSVLFYAAAMSGEVHGIVLQCVEVCCSVLQCVAVCCSVLHLNYYSTPPCARQPPRCDAVCCSAWQYVAVCCSVLQCVKVCCN